MSRRAAIVEDEFDDDTDLPLPSRPLPNTGTRGPLLEAIDGDDDDDDDDEDNDAPELIDTEMRGAGSASSNLDRERARMGLGPDANFVTDVTPYKKCVCLSYLHILYLARSRML